MWNTYCIRRHMEELATLKTVHVLPTLYLCTITKTFTDCLHVYT